MKEETRDKRDLTGYPIASEPWEDVFHPHWGELWRFSQYRLNNCRARAVMNC